MARWPLFPVTVVGSWPRPTWLLEAMKRGRADLHALQDEATLLAIKYQEEMPASISSRMASSDVIIFTRSSVTV